MKPLTASPHMSPPAGAPAGGGRTGALIRSMDWAGTPLGPAESWPPSLRTALGICLDCTFPILIWWGPHLVKLYNDAYSQLIADKHPAALGAPGATVWPEIWDTIGPMLARVMASGEAAPATDMRLVLNRRGYPEECYFSFSYSPIRDESGGVGGVFCPVMETTARVLGERRLAFLLDLEQRLRDIETPDGVRTLIGELVGRHLGVAQAGYADLDDTTEHIVVVDDWNDGRLCSMAGRHVLDSFGRPRAEALRAGQTVAIGDVRLHELTATPEAQASYAARSVRAILNMPLIKGGRLVAILYALHPEPRVWTEAQVSLFADVAERTWSSIERIRADIARREQKARLEALIRTVPAAVWFTQLPDIQQVTGNRMAAELLRFPHEANMSLTSWSNERSPHLRVLHDGVEIAPAGLPLQRAVRGEVVPAEEYEFVFEDGGSVCLLAQASPLRDAAGQIAGAVCAAVDITARKQAEAALRHSEEEFRALAENLPNLCWMAHEDGRIYWYNRRWYDYTGLTSAVLEGLAWQSVHDPDTLPAVLERWGKCLADGVAFEMTFPLRGVDGVFRPFLTRIVPVRDAAGVITRWFGSNVDISAQRQAEMELRRLNESLESRVRQEVEQREQAQLQLAHAQRMEALGQLAGGIAHDFNNVLQAVSGGLSLIQRRASDVEVVRQLAGMAADAAARGAAITGRLLAFARKGELKTALVDPDPLLQDLREMLAHALGSSIAVTLLVPPGTPPLLADRAQLETVLVNLAVNARDAMPKGGELTVSAAAETVRDPLTHPAGLPVGRYVRLTVADTGHGMDAATLARASEPFFTTKPVGQGTGLGLAMARGFAQQSGGGFALASTVGRGTEVTLWFPQEHAHAADADPGGAAATPPPPVAGPLVLVVDDDALVREVLAGHLEDRGYRTLQASDGLAALARFDAGEAADLMVTDLSMPGMNGLVLIEEARRRRPDLPIVLLTGYADAGLHIAGTYAAGGSAAPSPEPPDVVILRKPVSGDELAAHAAALLGGGPASQGGIDR